MNYKQLLIDSQRSGVSALLEFVLQYHNFDKVIAGFVEGKDYSYYRSRVEENIDNQYEVLFYPCNGKSEVELVKNMIDSNLNLKNDVKVLYFCDNDYGIKDKKEGIFYTDYYSVENYYTQENFIKNIVVNVFNISKYNPDYNICISLFLNRYEEFYKQIVKVNAYCYGIRLYEKVYNKKRADFNIIKISSFIENDSFQHFKMKKLDYEELKKIFSDKIVISNDDYKKYLEKIDTTKLRGKWELQFVIWFLENIRKEIKNGSSGLTKNNKKFISFENEIMTSMEKYAITTENLISYITDYTNR